MCWMRDDLVGRFARIGNGQRQVVADQCDRRQRMDIHHRRTGGGDIGFNGVGQRVNAGAGGQVRIHGQGGFRIHQRHVRHDALADNGDFVAPVSVVNDGELRDVGSGAGGGRDADQWRARPGNPVNPLKIEDMTPIWPMRTGQSITRRASATGVCYAASRASHAAPRTSLTRWPTPFIVVPTEQRVGLTTVALGLVHALDREGIPVGFCKPISQLHASGQPVTVARERTLGYSPCCKFGANRDHGSVRPTSPPR